MVPPKAVYRYFDRSAATRPISLHARRRHIGHVFSRIHLEALYWSSEFGSVASSPLAHTMARGKVQCFLVSII